MTHFSHILMNVWKLETLLSSRLLSKDLKTKIYKTIIFSVVLYGCEAYSLILMEERRSRGFENRILSREFGPKRDVSGEWKRLQNEELHSMYRLFQIVRVIKSRRLRWSGQCYLNFNRYTCRKEIFRKARHRWRTILEWALKRYVSMRGIGLIRLRIWIIGEPLWMRHWTSGIHKPWS